jgi:hypothetical protein
LLTIAPKPSLYNLVKTPWEMPKNPEASRSGFLRSIPARSIDNILDDL